MNMSEYVVNELKSVDSHETKPGKELKVIYFKEILRNWNSESVFESSKVN